MSELIIFGGTTEGRELAELCAENCIEADISVATNQGAEVLPDSPFLSIHTGRLSGSEMTELFRDKDYTLVIDATHPYAAEVTKNIRSACESTGTKYIRLLRDKAEIVGLRAGSVKEAVEILNRSDKIILSTLGSKELPELRAINNYHGRVWIRALPREKTAEYCGSLGFDANKLILEKGPFSVEKNSQHINRSGAEILLTKESGAAGGYPEKASAAEICGIEMLTITRPEDSGKSFSEVLSLIEKVTGRRIKA